MMNISAYIYSPMIKHKHCHVIHNSKTICTMVPIYLHYGAYICTCEQILQKQTSVPLCTNGVRVRS